ncbi:MAG: hypothetical protein FJ290_17130 [Planctomycetes bacterium]|nr:hypothetical protein [Planctomycetota bacterium]
MRGIAAIALLCAGIVPALGGGTDEPFARLPGTLLVCKEYGTVLGTYLTDIRGRDIARLNYLFGEGVGPRFSPDGERILYTSTRGGTLGLWVMARKGDEPRRICDGDQGDWFPDGRRIAFRRTGRIVERALDTGKETAVSPAAWEACSSPACSPDGRQVLFVVGDGDRDAIFLVTPGAAEPKRLAEGETLAAPRWAPAGDRIAYESEAHIWLMDADGSNKRQLTTGGGIQRRPVWSPDGAAIAYCQGPTPRGPWQLAVTRADGTRTFSVPQERARSVLCSDWHDGKKPELAKAAMAHPPRIRLWEIAQPPAAAPADWAAFCRERKGWRAVPIGEAPPQGERAGYAAESEGAVLLLLAGGAGTVLVRKAEGASPVALVPLGKETKPTASVRLVRSGPERIEAASSVSWSFDGTRGLVQATPLDGASKLRISAPLRCIVATDRFGNDIVADMETVGALPWAPVVVGLLGNGSHLLALVCPEQGQRIELQKGGALDVAFQGRPLTLGFLACTGAWHLERFGDGPQADPLRFKWRMPFPATWRLTVLGDGKRYSALFSDKESEIFDRSNVLYRGGKAQLGLIYLYGRVASTPLETVTPVDLVRDALGLKGAERALDEDGLTSYRTAAGPTTWAELSVTIQSLRYLFERQLEAQDSAYVGHLCDDIPLFVEGMDQRLAEYAGFAREVQRQEKALSATAQKLAELAGRTLTSPKALAPLCARIKQLAAKESSTNRKEFEDCCKEIIAVVGPREEMLRSCRKLAIELRDAAGNAPLAQPELAEKIRGLCQTVLRNRLYVEADWRGESYAVPAFWLGPRPYE